jgi:hypothetical protein
MTTKEKKDFDATLAEHGHYIGDLDRRMGRFENEMRTVQTDLKAVTLEVNKASVNSDKNFADLKNMIDTNQAKQGLGTVENIRVIAMGGSIVGMSAAAIGFLVQAYNAPTLTRLETSQTKVEQSSQRRDAQEQAELVALRKRDQERADSEFEKLKAAIEDLKVRVGWTKVEIRR